MAAIVKTYIRQEVTPFKLVSNEEPFGSFGELVDTAIDHAIQSEDTLQEVRLEWEPGEWKAYVTGLQRSKTCVATAAAKPYNKPR